MLAGLALHPVRQSSNGAVVACVAVSLQTPNMAICDANLVDGMPKSLTAFGGLDALVHALESYVSVCATDYTKGEDSMMGILCWCSTTVGSCATVAQLVFLLFPQPTRASDVGRPCAACQSPCVVASALCQTSDMTDCHVSLSLADGMQACRCRPSR